MAGQLQSISISAPSFFGLNTQDSSVDLPQQFALQADNAVIDRFGRIGARKGMNQFSDVQFVDDIWFMHEHINSDATRQLYFGAGGNIYEVDLNGVTTLDFTHPTATFSNWQPFSFNGELFLVQEGEQPIHYFTQTMQWELIGTAQHTSLPAGVQWFGTASAVYGRVWAARTNLNKTTLFYSDTLIGYQFQGGASGSLSLETVFPDGTDEIVHIAGFNGFLVIFCRNSIIIYQGAEDPNTMSLVEAIDGVGCIARDSVQDTGTDLIFLSSQGVRSLQRVIQEKSTPQRDLSRNVRDQFLVEVLGEANPIKTAYSPRDAFYAVALNSLSKVYVFDLRANLENGGARVTTWSGVAPTAFEVTRIEEVLHVAEGGFINKYENYSDRGNAYQLSYLTNHISAGNLSTRKILKEANVLLLGGSEDKVVFRHDVNYGTNYTTTLRILPKVETAEFGISEYNIAEYSQGETISTLKFNIGKTGRVFQFGLTIDVFAEPISIQQIDVFFKQGRLT